MAPSPLTLPPMDRPTRVAFAVLVASVVFSLAGSLALKLFPALMGYVGAYYVTLVKAPTWIYMTLLPIAALLLYAPSTGWPRVLRLLVLGTVIGGASELLGTTTGFPFGEYLYTAWLGPKLFDHVPWFIPPSWFAMSIVSYDFAGRLASGRVGRVLLTGVFMVAWDVSLDPAMSMAFPFWSYPAGGEFYGMPLSNWAGWFAVSAVIAVAYEAVGGGRVKPQPAAPLFYGINCAFPILLSLVYGLEGAAVIGAVVTAGVLLLVDRAGRTGAGSTD